MTSMSSAPHVRLLGSILRSKADCLSLAYVERGDPSGEIFASTRFLARLVGHIFSIHNNMYHYINTVEIKSAAEDAGIAGDGFEINTSNIINVTEEHLSDVKKQQMARPSMASRLLAFSHSAWLAEMGRSFRK